MHLCAVVPSFILSLMWEAGMGTKPCHINMRTGKMLTPVLQLPGPAAMEAVANVTGYGFSR